MYNPAPVIWKKLASAPDKDKLLVPNPSSVIKISEIFTAEVVFEFSKTALIVFAKVTAVGA